MVCRSLLKQLVQRIGQLPKQVDELYERSVRINSKPSTKEILDTLLSSLPKDARIFVVIDAIDECSESYRYSILELVSKLQRESARIFVTCRPHIEPSAAEGEVWKQVEIAAQEEDIRLFFEQCLQQRAASGRD